MRIRKLQTQELNQFDTVGRLFLLHKLYKKVGKKNPTSAAFWYAICSCGKTKVIQQSELKRGGTKSCGCLHLEQSYKHLELARKVPKIRKYHEDDWDLYIRWKSIKSRTLWIPEYDKNYKIYRGKGIKICQEWLDFNEFKKWAISSGFKKELTIDRIDSSKDYQPDNCRWVTMAENLANR